MIDTSLRPGSTATGSESTLVRVPAAAAHCHVTPAITWVTQAFIERFHAQIGAHRNKAMWTFWKEPVSRRLCIKKRTEWAGLLASCGFEELFSMSA
jgi:hypothetical protein